MTAESCQKRRHFLGSSLAAAAVSMVALPSPGEDAGAVDLPDAHQDAVRKRHRRIVVQQDVHWVMVNYAKMNPGVTPPFGPFRDVAFSYVDQPGSQIDAIWWDIGGNPTGAAHPSQVAPRQAHPLVERWLKDGVDWVEQLVSETRKRKLEVFWNHRVSEVDLTPEGAHAKEPDVLKAEHPDWVLPATWWPHGMWNLAAQGLRDHKVAVIRELAERYDLDGMQIDFSRHVPCLPMGRQWELRGAVTEFMRAVRVALLEIAKKRGRPLLLAAKVPETVAGCRADGFDVAAWAKLRLVDVLTLGSRTMDVDVEGVRAAVGNGVQLQPCFDDHHATDGYRYGPIEFLRGVFANHFQRGADSVVTFNWALATAELAKSVGGEIAPPTHEAAYKEVGDPKTMAGKDKIYAVERRGGYPWADGYFNRNDGAPLPAAMAADGKRSSFTLHVSDAQGHLTIRCILFGADKSDEFELQLNGTPLAISLHDAEWKDPQIFSPAPQPASGGKGQYGVNPKQRLLRVEWVAPTGVWKQGVNRIEIGMMGTAEKKVQVEKVEGILRYG